MLSKLQSMYLGGVAHQAPQAWMRWVAIFSGTLLNPGIKPICYISCIAGGETVFYWVTTVARLSFNMRYLLTFNIGYKIDTLEVKEHKT